MGLPQQPDQAKQAPPDETTATTPTAPPASDRPSASSLPPEALDLATKLFDFAREGKTAELDRYLSAGVPVNLTNHKGDTLLMLASYHGHVETVRLLLRKGADTEVLNERGQSPIAGAVFKGSDDVVRALLEAGASTEAGQPNAVDCARMFKREEVLEMFGVREEV